MVGRERERQILTDLAETRESQLAVVYGRRRVGKTYLVQQTFKNQLAFSHTGLEDGTREEEIYAFWDSLRDFGWECDRPANWFDAFAELKKYLVQLRSPRKIVFLDELPWMDTARSEFLKVLEKFWNGWAAGRDDIFLIVCGSAAAWMTRKVLQNRGGLFNRASRQIYVQPFTLKECEELVKVKSLEMDRRDIVSAYMILGGAAYYWNLLDRGESLSQNIDRLFFSRAGDLAHEFLRLYKSVFRNPDPYIAIVTALGTKKIGMTREELVEHGKGISGNGNLTACLENLEISGFIRKYRVRGGTRNGYIYQLMDNYTLFYFKFISECKGDEHFWSHNAASSMRRSWEGLAFERVCLQHVDCIKKALGISGVESLEYAWQCQAEDQRGKGAQIDLVIDRADRVVNLCEMKFTAGEYDITDKEAVKLRNRLETFRGKAKVRTNVHLTMVTASGVKRGKYRNLYQSEIKLDDLFL